MLKYSGRQSPLRWRDERIGRISTAKALPGLPPSPGGLKRNSVPGTRFHLNPPRPAAIPLIWNRPARRWCGWLTHGEGRSGDHPRAPGGGCCHAEQYPSPMDRCSWASRRRSPLAPAECAVGNRAGAHAGEPAHSWTPLPMAPYRTNADNDPSNPAENGGFSTIFRKLMVDCADNRGVGFAAAKWEEGQPRACTMALSRSIAPTCARVRNFRVGLGSGQ